MDKTNFVDHVRIYFRSGSGGAGSVHFHRSKNIPKGGPDGGDGGKGGSIFLQGDNQLWTLLHLKYSKHVHAQDGESGSGADKSGKDGENIILKVPLGTVARDAETGEVLCEVLEHGEKKLLLEGGIGGLGNTHFKSATNQTPKYAQPGIEGKEAFITLELKVLADIGLVGFPNAGKSTLLSVISKAKPEIGAYPFTTLTPNLGIIPYRDYKSFIMADIPGIIEGAHAGKGLGVRFLRHIERNSILLFLIPSDSKDIIEQYNILLNELKLYNPDLLDKNRVIGISKTDLLDEELKEMIKKDIQDKLPADVPYIFFSAVGQQNLMELKDLIWKVLHGK